MTPELAGVEKAVEDDACVVNSEAAKGSIKTMIIPPPKSNLAW